jgi:hypothetical protein
LKPCGIWLRAGGKGLRVIRNKIQDTRYKREGFVFMTIRLNGTTAQWRKGLLNSRPEF